jgi:hypothetical protein
MNHDEIKRGVCVRLLSNYLDVPTGTKASVEDICTLNHDWWFTVRFSNYQPITPVWSDSRRKRSLRYNVSSLHLRESDLTRFELVTETEIEPVPSTARPPAAPKLPAGWQDQHRE